MSPPKPLKAFDDDIFLLHFQRHTSVKWKIKGKSSFFGTYKKRSVGLDRAAQDEKNLFTPKLRSKAKKFMEIGSWVGKAFL